LASADRIGDERHGFTLIEIVIAVAIMAVLTAAVVPLVYRHLDDARITAAQVDVEAIGTSLQHFHADTGLWPTELHNNHYSRLVSQGSGQCGNEGIAGGDGSVATSELWQSTGNVYNFTDLLVFNQAQGKGDPLFTESNFPSRKPGWHGPYMAEIHSDPWGRPYVCNITWGAYQPGQAGYRNDLQHNILVVSSGPNGVFETPFGDATSVVGEQVGGDDIGFVVRHARP